MLLRRIAPVVLALTLLSGCSGSGSGSDGDSGAASRVGSIERTPASPPTEYDEPLCPRELPMGEDVDGLGLGADDPAEKAPPAFETPPAAWVCAYGFRDTKGDSGGAPDERWVRVGAGRFVPEARLPALAEALSELEPAAEDRVCTADLGLRLLLVVPRQDGLTGIVRDEFGCGDVRMTDDPFATTAPGEEDGDETVAGVLTGPLSLYAALAVNAAPR